jgi:hypothetical protein
MASVSAKWVPQTAGERQLLAQLGAGIHGFAVEVRDRARGLAPYGTGVHPPRSKTEAFYFHYRDTIRATTYVEGKRIAGFDVSAKGFGPARRTIESIVYTTARPFGHIYELTGAGPHKIPHTIGAGGHPGVRKRPHFVPGLLIAAQSAGPTIRKTILSARATASYEKLGDT